MKGAVPWGGVKRPDGVGEAVTARPDPGSVFQPDDGLSVGGADARFKAFRK